MNLKITAGIVAVALSVALAYGCWRVGRYVNYSLQYEDMVRATVREMVKPEALREVKP